MKNNVNIEKRRKLVEGVATFGMLLIAVGLIAPFANLTSYDFLRPFKWIFSSGALLYLLSRVVGATDPSDSLRVRRLRRIQFWAGVAFGIAAFFWFYKEAHAGPYAGPLYVLNETILFSLVGALLQVISSWLIVARQKKESKQNEK